MQSRRVARLTDSISLVEYVDAVSFKIILTTRSARVAVGLTTALGEE